MILKHFIFLRTLEGELTAPEDIKKQWERLATNSKRNNVLRGTRGTDICFRTAKAQRFSSHSCDRRCQSIADFFLVESRVGFRILFNLLFQKATKTHWNQ